jgi:hypothetical protein
MVPIKHANNDTKEYTDRRHKKNFTCEQITEWFEVSRKTLDSTPIRDSSVAIPLL